MEPGFHCVTAWLALTPILLFLCVYEVLGAKVYTTMAGIYEWCNKYMKHVSLFKGKYLL